MEVFLDLAERMTGLPEGDRLLLTLWYFAPNVPIPEIATVAGCSLDEVCRRRKELVMELFQDELGICT